MREFLIVYVVCYLCAAAALVWWTLNERGGRDLQAARGKLRYVAISDYLLLEWAGQVPDLVILDLHMDRGIGGWEEFASYWLPISLTDLPSLLKWLPRTSMVVFCCREATQQLDDPSKTALMQAGIGTVYFLEESPVFPADRCFDHDAMTRVGNPELRKTMRQRRCASWIQARRHPLWNNFSSSV